MKSYLLVVICLIFCLAAQANVTTLSSTTQSVVLNQSNNDDDTLTIGAQIKKAREAKKVTITDLAKEIELSVKNVENIEKDLVIPTLDVLVQIQEYLNCEIILDAEE